MAEKMVLTSETGDFGRLYRLSRYVLNGHCKPGFALLHTTDQLISEQHEKIERRREHFGQLLNQPLHQKANPLSSVRSEPYDIKCR